MGVTAAQGGRLTSALHRSSGSTYKTPHSDRHTSLAGSRPHHSNFHASGLNFPLRDGSPVSLRGHRVCSYTAGCWLLSWKTELERPRGWSDRRFPWQGAMQEWEQRRRRSRSRTISPPKDERCARLVRGLPHTSTPVAQTLLLSRYHPQPFDLRVRSFNLPPLLSRVHTGVGGQKAETAVLEKLTTEL